jgi:hypothetical protein
VVDDDAGLVVVPVTGGVEVLGRVAARLADRAGQITEMALRRPSLDEVFLALTGQPAEPSPVRAETGTGR